MADTSEFAPLLPHTIQPTSNSSRTQRTVSFNPQTTVSHPSSQATQTSPLRPAPSSSLNLPTSQYGTNGQPILSTLNERLRRRNSHGSRPSPNQNLSFAPKIGPQRTTKNAQKLKLLPNPDPGDEGPDEESGRDVYSQFTRIKDPTARRDAARLGKADRDKLPRVTAYCTASSYRLEGLMKFLKGRGRSRGANPKQFDECIYSPYGYGRSKSDKKAFLDNINVPSGQTNSAAKLPLGRERRYSDSIIEVDEGRHQRREELIDLSIETEDLNNQDGESLDTNQSNSDLDGGNNLDFDTQVHTPEIFLFEYGTVVIWGMTLQQEQRFLKEISKFEKEKLSEEDVQTENFNFYYTREYQARIYNDFISLREKKNYMTKLAISHALAQSVKVCNPASPIHRHFPVSSATSDCVPQTDETYLFQQTSLFEDLVSTTITQTTPLPEQIALTGSIALTRRQITMQIGQLFILRINIHLQGSVLDSPELMWAEPQLEPIYGAVRSYLEMDQRVGLLTERLDVIADLLAVLKDQVRTSHGEYLEWIGETLCFCLYIRPLSLTKLNTRASLLCFEYGITIIFNSHKNAYS